MTAAKANLQATALFSTRPDLDADDLLLALNGRLAREPDSHLTLSPLTHQDWWLLTCGRFHIMVSVHKEPVDRKTFKAALRAPVNTVQKFDFAGAAGSHRAALSVEIGDGATPLPPEARAIMQEFGASEACDPQLKLKVLHWVLQEMAQSHGLLAVHFGPSDRMFSPDDLAAAAASDIPHDLLFHPVPGDPTTNPEGVEGYSLRPHPTAFSEGPQPELEGIPRTLPLSTAVALLATVTRAGRTGKLPLDHGCVLQPSEKRQLFIRHVAPDAERPAGRIVVSFWGCMGHDAPAPDMTELAGSEPASETGDASAADATVDPTEAMADTLAAKAEALAQAQASSDDEIGAAPAKRRFAFWRRKAKTAAAAPQAPEIEDGYDGAPGDRHAPGDAILVSTEAAQSVAYAEEIYDAPEELLEDAVQAAQLSPQDRRFDLRLKMVGLAVILGLPSLWNPYDGFTGGISVGGASFADAATSARPAGGTDDDLATLTATAGGDVLAAFDTVKRPPEGEVLRPRLRPDRELALLNN